MPPDKFLRFLKDDNPNEFNANFFAGRGFLVMILLALAGGLALNLTPCVLPLIPVNLVMIGASGSKAETTKKDRILRPEFGCYFLRILFAAFPRFFHPFPALFIAELPV